MEASAGSNRPQPRHVPPEILQPIFGFGTRDLGAKAYRSFCLSAALVCQSWLEPALRQLYERIDLNSRYDNTSTLVAKLAQCPVFGRYPLRKIVWIHEEAFRVRYLYDMLDYFETFGMTASLRELQVTTGYRNRELVSLARIVQKVPSLEVIDFITLQLECNTLDNVAHDSLLYRQPCRLTSIRYESIDPDVYQYWLHTRCPCFNKLKRLDLVTINFTFDPSIDSCSKVALCERVTRVHVGNFFNLTPEESQCHFANLKTLVVGDRANEYQEDNAELFDKWEMPSLEAVEVQGFVYADGFSAYLAWLELPSFTHVKTWTFQHGVVDHTNAVRFLDACKRLGITVLFSNGPGGGGKAAANEGVHRNNRLTVAHAHTPSLLRKLQMSPKGR